MSVIGIIGRFFEDARERRRRIRTERMIGELPAEIRRDIGWSGTYPGPSRLSDRGGAG